jgi:integrase
MGIKKLSKNKYQARYFAGYKSNGKRVYPSKTFRTLKDASAWLTIKMREKHLGQYAESSTLTLAQYLDQWLEAKKQSIRANTHHNYSVSVDNYLRNDLGRIRLSALRPHHIEQWQSNLLSKLSSATVSSVRGMLGGALQRAVKHKLINQNPVRDAESVKLKKTEMHCLTPEQAHAFLSECKGQIGLLLKFMLNTGLRPEEIAGTRWKDLTLEDRGSVQVNEVVLRLHGGGWRFGPPKTNNAYRRVGFPSSLVAELKEHRRTQLENRLKLGKRYQDRDLVFAGPDGEPVSRGAVRRKFKPLLKRAGLPDAIRIYDLRHSFVTLSLVAGVDVKTVSEEAGHGSVSFTLDNYGHVLQVMRDSAVDKREALFSAQK